MHLSSRTIVVLILLLNLLVAGLGVAEGMVRASVEEERRTRLPIDTRYCLPRDPNPVPAQGAPAVVGTLAAPPADGQ